MDLKVIPRCYKGYKFNLVVIDEENNRKIIGDGSCLIEHVFSKYSIPECMIMDQDSEFILFNYLFKNLDINIKTVASYNHPTLQLEHGSKNHP